MKRYLAVFALLFALAELAAACLPPSAVLPSAAFVFVLCAAAALLCRRHERRFPGWAPAAGAVLGLLWFAAYRALVFLPTQTLDGQTVYAVATVQTDCAASYGDGMLRGTLLLEEVEGYPGTLRVSCQAFPAQTAGERFRACFTLSALPDDVYRANHYADGVYLQAGYEGGYQARDAARAPRFWLYDLRQALSARLRRYLPQPYSGMIAAMLLGDRTHLDAEVRTLFQSAGVAHLLSVSGLHISLLCGLFALGRGGKERFSRPRIVFRAALILFYMALTGFPISVVRAGSAFLLSLLGDLLLQPPDLLTSMGVTALLLGLQNAFAPGDVGFQLSFCAVLGVYLAGLLAGWEGKHSPGSAPARLALRILDAVQTAALAALATLPVLLAHSMTASGVAVLGNLATVWMLRPALLLGLLMLTLSAVPPLAPCAHMASLLLAVWMRLMLAILRVCASLPMARLYLPRRYALWVLAVLGVLACMFWSARREVPMIWYLPAAALCTALAIGAGVLLSRDVVTVALVGAAGNPCAVVTQNGQATVLFRGGASNQEAVQSYLADHGAPELALAVDIRQQPQEMQLDAARTLTVAELPQQSEVPLGPGLVLRLYRRPSGYLALLETEDASVAVMSGNIRLDQPLEVDVYCAGSAWPQDLRAATVVTNSPMPRWRDRVQEQRVYYGAQYPSVVLRPGCSMTFEGAKPLAVQ